MITGKNLIGYTSPAKGDISSSASILEEGKPMYFSFQEAFQREIDSAAMMSPITAIQPHWEQMHGWFYACRLLSEQSPQTIDGGFEK